MVLSISLDLDHPTFSRTAFKCALRKRLNLVQISVGYVRAYHFVLCAHSALAVQIQDQTFAQRATPCARAEV
eukprot:3759209-Rhodomonas_salina.1